MCLSYNTIWGNLNHATIQQISLNKYIKFHGKQNRHMCHYVEIMRVYKNKNGEKQFCLNVALLQKMAFIWDGRNPLSVTGSYSQGTWHAHHVKRTSSISNGVNKQLYIYLLGDGMITPTGTDPKPAQLYMMGAVHCSCRTDCNTRHCLCLYIVQTNVPMWHLTHDGIEVMPF